VPVNYVPAIFPEPLRDFANYLLNLIHWRWCCWKANAKGFVQLKYDYLIRFIPLPYWKQIRNTLMDHEIIESDLTSAQGEKCKGYRLCVEYRNTRRVLCTNAALNRKIGPLGDSAGRPLLPVHRWLEGKLGVLVFVMARALPIIAGMKPGKGSRLTAAEYRLRRKEYCQRIANGDFWFCCDVYGRVHTPLTALERDLRGCLEVEGQPLIGIDLANSQPLLLGLFERKYFASKGARHRFLNAAFDGKGHPYAYKAVRGLAGAENVPADLERYLRVCERGAFYESLMSHEEKSRGEKYRRRFKKRFYGVLFGKNRQGRFPNQLRARFRERYPSVWKVLRALKRRNYRHSAHVLQNYEATLFVYLICGRIMKERPGIALYTIHDSILTTPDAVEYVRSVILDEFRRLGVRPKLHREDNA
jgi:hypothetical protein